MTNNLPGIFLLLPFFGAVLTFLFPGRVQTVIGVFTTVLVLASALALAAKVYFQGPMQVALGGWPQPLGIGMHIDGLSVLFILLTSFIGLLVCLYSRTYFLLPSHQRQGPHFWPLYLLLLGALNALFCTADIFNTYVLLELLGISAAALAALSGDLSSLTAALRYFLVALAGSLAFLLGISFIYAQTGTLDFP
ncbi:MAG: hypothetical protein KGY41_01055, partial [Desulfovermiculus sp.]|nr:hypothetical protein [Desulfovermiculus sp.]